MNIKLHHGNNIDVLKTLDADSIDSIVTDPPYGISFMGKQWDYDVPTTEFWKECYRVLKPGGHVLSFAGTRTQHRMAVRIEDAGFEIRDMIAWVYGSGFPKSMDVSKAIDKAEGAERTTGERVWNGGARSGGIIKDSDTEVTTTRIIYDDPATEAAKQWQGWGTALKPALEPITVARKPLIGTVVENVLEHGTGGINIDGCRVFTEDRLGGGNNSSTVNREGKHEGWQRPWMENADLIEQAAQRSKASTEKSEALGRWPANLIHDGSDEVTSLFPESKSTGGQASLGAFRSGEIFGKGRDERETRDPGFGDSGSASRFFYCAKTSKSDRGDGNIHPTVKPTDLMRYLCRLVTPPGGTIMDPFMGSGSTGKAAKLENLNFVGIELNEEYFKIAKDRINNAVDSVKDTTKPKSKKQDQPKAGTIINPDLFTGL
jgi:DNA modification methylase